MFVWFQFEKSFIEIALQFNWFLSIIITAFVTYFLQELHLDDLLQIPSIHMKVTHCLETSWTKTPAFLWIS